MFRVSGETPDHIDALDVRMHHVASTNAPKDVRTMMKRTEAGGINELPAFGSSRRTILQGVVSTLSLSALAPILIGRPAVGRAAAVNNRALTILYPAGPKIRFDANYYRDHHLKLFMDIYGSAIERFELRVVDSSKKNDPEPLVDKPGSTSPFAAILNIWIADYALFSARSTDAAYKKMGDDKPNFTNTQSTVEVDEIRAAVGEPRTHVKIGDQCISFLFPNGTGTEWDVDAYSQKQLPMIMKRLGSAAVRRIEVRTGLNLLDAGAPAYMGGANIYVKNRRTFDAAWAQHGAELEAEAARLASVKPLRLDTVVYGVDTTHHDA